MIFPCHRFFITRWVDEVTPIEIQKKYKINSGLSSVIYRNKSSDKYCHILQLKLTGMLILYS